jgi:hypothetical protein
MLIISEMSNYSNHPEISKYEWIINEWVNHNIQKYKYVGEKGKEYEVIQSVFYEINQLPELSNQQIRWYSIIIYLIRSFYNQRYRGSFPDFSLPEPVYGFKVLTNVEKDRPMEWVVPAPPYIERIELYLTEIARMGVLISSKKEINTHYIDYKLDRIGSILIELLDEMNSQMRGEHQEEVFVITIKNAADNVIKFLKNRDNHFTKSVTSKMYGELIIKRIENIDKNRLTDYYNMEAFWNGFIP